MMKQALVVLALVGLAFSAPQPRKLFSEHFHEFMNVIEEEIGDEVGRMVDEYMQYEEFQSALTYVASTNFRDLIYEMEALPEFNAVVDFLENDNIDIHTFIDFLNGLLSEYRVKRSARQTISGTSLTSYIYDCIAIFPKEKLAALYDEKMSNDEAFRTAINNLQSEEWKQVYGALWENEIFLNEVKTLNDNGVDVYAILDEFVAIFGQN